MPRGILAMRFPLSRSDLRAVSSSTGRGNSESRLSSSHRCSNETRVENAAGNSVSKLFPSCDGGKRGHAAGVTKGPEKALDWGLTRRTFISRRLCAFDDSVEMWVRVSSLLPYRLKYAVCTSAGPCEGSSNSLVVPPNSASRRPSFSSMRSSVGS